MMAEGQGAPMPLGGETVWLHGTGLAGLRWGPGAVSGFWPDLPGQGNAPRATPTPKAYADAIAPSLPPRFALAGHSLGGMVAMELAAEMPDRVRALILLDTPLSLPSGPPRWLGARAAGVLARIPGPRGFARVVARRTENVAARPAVKAAIAATPRAGFADAMRTAAAFDGRSLLPRLTLPILCLLGRDSFLTGSGEAEAFGAMRNAEVRDFAAGHMLPMDAAHRIDPLMTRFLQAHP